MKLIAIQERDIYGLFEISQTQALYLERILNHCEITMDLSDPLNKKAHEYFVNEFYKQIQTFSQKLKEQYGFTPAP